MKFTLSWLKDHLDTSEPLKKICDTLTMIGLEVESVADRAAELKPFTVAKILHAEQHPQADKLRVCKVQSDIGELQIVCGAPNARAGLYVVLAKEGVTIPNGGFVIKKTKIRGVESNGMLCSADELNLGSDSSGIIELPGEPKIGESVVSILGLDDPVIEIAITPNRADALSVHGVARDLAAAGLGKLKSLPDVSGFKGGFASPVQVGIKDDNKCQQFIGAYIKGVKNGASPDWLKKRLESIGQKPISALVDITNYITIDLGRPLHVFDAKKLRGNLVVRNSKPGESLQALNGKSYILPEGMTVIADDSGVLSLGGIIGGEATGCTEATTDVFLEVALFDPAQVAQTGRSLQIDSDARYRFERGVDVDFVETGALHALRLIKQLCGGEASALTLAGKTPQWQRTLRFAPERVKTLGGVDVSPEKSIQILSALGFAANREEAAYAVSPPSWRADVENEADLVEEVLRIHGYDHIPVTPLPQIMVTTLPVSPAQQRVKLAKDILSQRGMLELCTWSFLPEAQAKAFGNTNAKLKLLNPISEDLNTMRPSLLPNLLDAAKRNAARGIKEGGFFEVGLQFHDVTPDGQRMVASGIRINKITEARYSLSGFQLLPRPVDAFDAKTDAVAALQTLGINKYEITTDVPAWYHPGQSGTLMLGKTVLGHFGVLHPALLLNTYDFKQTLIAGFEIFLDAIPQSRAKGKAKPPLKISNFQIVDLDFAFVIDNSTLVIDLYDTIRKAHNLITEYQVFDKYTGDKIEPGKASIAIEVKLQAMDRTLSEQDIASASKAIIDAVQKKHGGQLRQ
jgi:phenylalanyl-tRNA synthetase beta chain